jgi:uncharacterized membrane protein
MSHRKVPLERLGRLWETIRRAFVEFQKIPTFVIVGFLLLAAVMYVLDAARIVNEEQASKAKWGGLFTDAQTTRDLLGVIAGSIITVASITLSLLLVAVQQGAASLTSLVFDQFLRRRTNQIYFGFFIGMALYSLIVLSSITPFHQPVYGVMLAGVMILAALYMLIILIYTTIDQMRPVVIMNFIHDLTLRARERQFDLLRSTRRAARLQGGASTGFTADCSGFLTRLDVTAIAKAVTETETEVVILPSVGDYVAFGDPIAEIRMARLRDGSSLESAIRKAVVLEQQRDLDTDAAFGIDQLVTIGWTSTSTAKSNPGPALLAIWNLRDLLARWLQSDAAFGSGEDDAADPAAPVVYSDNLPERLMKGFESLAVVASESLQHQSVAEIYRAFANLFHRLPPPLRRQAEDLLLRSLSGLGDHILTSDLEAALSALIDALAAAGRPQSAAAIGAAQHQLGLSIGRLNSRSTRTEVSGDRILPSD